MAKKRANGEGNIRKRKDGRWEGRYTAGYDEKTGKRLIKNILGKTRAEVKEKLAKAVAEAETVDVRRADEYTLGTWLQTWYELYAKPHLRFSTAEYYRRGIELHITPRIDDIPLKKLTGRDLQGLYKDLREHGRLREAQKGKQPGLSDSTIRGIHTMLHNALDRAVKERLIVRNPADDCVPPKIPKHEMKILPPEQIKSYLTAANQRGVLPMFYLELISGLRKGELVALQWSDLDIENKTISVSKQAGRNNAQANPTSHVRKRKTRSEKSPSRRMPLICWSQNTRNIPATHGCSHPRKQARCTTRTRWSTSTRKS
ncbi:MAG: site-specific integrase [Oscillospiraceae bacterium]